VSGVHFSCDPRRRWARFEVSWLRPASGCWASASSAQTASGAATLTTPTPALWQPPESKPAAPEVVAAGRTRIAAPCCSTLAPRSSWTQRA